MLEAFLVFCLSVILSIIFYPRRPKYIRRVTRNMNGQPRWRSERSIDEKAILSSTRLHSVGQLAPTVSAVGFVGLLLASRRSSRAANNAGAGGRVRFPDRSTPFQ